ncbi:MAG TPA: hypothetical protein VIJ57_09600 [Hanamia sp.]
MELEEEISHLKKVLSEIQDSYGDERKYYDVLTLLRSEKNRAKQTGQTDDFSYYWYLEVTEGDEGDGYITLRRKSNSKKAKYGLYKDFLDNFRKDVENEVMKKQTMLNLR